MKILIFLFALLFPVEGLANPWANVPTIHYAAEVTGERWVNHDTGKIKVRALDINGSKLMFIPEKNPRLPRHPRYPRDRSNQIPFYPTVRFYKFDSKPLGILSATRLPGEQDEHQIIVELPYRIKPGTYNLFITNTKGGSTSFPVYIK